MDVVTTYYMSRQYSYFDFDAYPGYAVTDLASIPKSKVCPTKFQDSKVQIEEDLCNVYACNYIPLITKGPFCDCLHQDVIFLTVSSIAKNNIR